MPPINLLIKPASGSCNMRCKYCFYADEVSNRETASYGVMKLEVLEQVVQKTLAHATGSCTFAFQGGEPTLAGLDFFRALITYEQKHNIKKLPIQNALQTNGYLIDEEWASFLGENRFLVGLSLDGHKDLHDFYRIDAHGDGTYKRVMHAAQLLNQHKVDFNILTVITAQTAKSIRKIYGFYRRNNFLYQQYIPCLDPIGEERGLHGYSLTPALYAEFLKTLFDLWYYDITHGNFIYIRYFENLVGMLLGEPPESCGMIGYCSMQYVLEADAGVYPCDFYVLDEYLLGNLTTDSFTELDQKRQEIGFVENSRYVSWECESCQWRPLCRGGCRRDREPMKDGRLSLNYFCPAYREFFSYAAPRLQEIARRVAAGTLPIQQKQLKL